MKEPLKPLSEADALYHLWLAAVARGDGSRAKFHAENLREVIRYGAEPEWSTDARASFYVWCGQKP